jgi:hypothetical protein
MSRWLDRLLIASNRGRGKNAKSKEESVTQTPAALRFEVRASYVMVFGEATKTSGKFRLRIDGKPHPPDAKEPTDLYDMASERFQGNWNYHRAIAENLDPNTPHILEIEPVFETGETQELRIESLCVAGGPAQVKALPAAVPPVGRLQPEKPRLEAGGRRVRR